MNVFEDLVGELKEDNLLEETVMQTQKIENNDGFKGAVADENDYFTNSAIYAQKINGDTQTEFSKPQSPSFIRNAGEIAAPGNFSENKSKGESAQSEKTVYAETISPDPFQKTNESSFDEQEFFRKRVIEEVAGLQMVEHVLSGVEREQNKSAPRAHNDIAVKKALHDFLQISEGAESARNAQARIQLTREIEIWCSALSHRDKHIPVAQLRRYCETTKPPLSSQALISLARFYRNLPYSESVRGKFDLVVTRLFSKDVGNEKRALMFERSDLIKHLTELYADWSSISLYSTEADESRVALTILKFEEFMAEAERAGNFDELINNDFFNRLRFLKESAKESFFAPLITAAAIESNIRVGNKYVDLIESERGKSNIQDFEDKYGFQYDRTVSDSTSKTLELIGLLREKENETVVEVKETDAPPTGKPAERKISKQSALFRMETKPEYKPNPINNRNEASKQGFEVNKGLLAGTIFSVILSIGLYVYVNYFADETNVATSVQKVELENSPFREHLQTARISQDTFYAVTLPSWNDLPTEKREELLRILQSFGKEKGYVKVHLLNRDGKAVGYANSEKTEVLTP